MRILVIGASQGTGAHAVKIALARNHDVTAFSRNPQKLGVQNPRLTYLPGDFHARDSVDAAVKGHDAVIVTASATSLKTFKEKPNFFSEGTQYVVDAMKKHGVKRLSVLSALGAGESYAMAPWIVKKIVIGGVLKRPFEDHGRQEQLVKDSGLEWTIARPGRLTDGAGKKKYVKHASLEKVPSSIAREDVADFLVEACEVDTWVRKAVQLGG